MADFDPFANQGGPAAWDPEHADNSKKQADELLNSLGEEAEPDAEPDGSDSDGLDDTDIDNYEVDDADLEDSLADPEADRELDLEFDEGYPEAFDED